MKKTFLLRISIKEQYAPLCTRFFIIFYKARGAVAKNKTNSSRHPPRMLAYQPIHHVFSNDRPAKNVDDQRD